MTPSKVEDDRKLIAEAVQVAAQADVIVVCLGGNEQTSREAWARNHMGDRTTLDLIGRQEELVNALQMTGKPVVVVLFNGSPLSINYVATETCRRFSSAGIWGRNAARRWRRFCLAITIPAESCRSPFPRSVGHLPAFYNYKPSARRGYLFDEVSPLYRVRLRLELHPFQLQKRAAGEEDASVRDGSTRVLVDVTNTGRRPGAEVVQMYIRDCVSSVTRPVKELKGFKKILLPPGETQTVALSITPESLAFYDFSMKYTVEPGEFEIMVGNSSRDEDLQKVILTVTQ